MSIFAQRILSSSMTAPVKNAVRHFLPDLTEAAIGIRQELRDDPALKKKIKKLAIWSVCLDAAEFALVAIPARVVRKFPQVQNDLAQWSREATSTQINSVHSDDIAKIGKVMGHILRTPSIARIELGVTMAEAARQFVAIAGAGFDIKLAASLFEINRKRLMRKLGADMSDPDQGGIIAKSFRTASDISTGLREEPMLRAKFLGLAAVEVASDVVDAKLGMGRHIPALIGSVIVSQIIGLKELDLTARAIGLGVAAKERDAKDPDHTIDAPVLGMLDALGMETQSKTIAGHLTSSRILLRALNLAARTVKVGAGSALLLGTNYLMNVVVNPMASPSQLQQRGMAYGLAATATGTLGTGAILAWSYVRGRRTEAGPENG